MQVITVLFKKIGLGIVILAGILFVVNIFNKHSQVPSDRLTLQQLQQDFTQFTQLVEQDVPNAFYNCSRVDFERAKLSVFNQLKDGMTVTEAFRVFYPIAQLLNDAHFAVHLPDHFFENKNNTFFPIRVIIDDDRLFVVKDVSDVPLLKKGEEILDINAISAKDIIQNIRATSLKDRNQQVFFEYRNESVFHKRLYALFQFKDEFEVRTSRQKYKLRGVSEQKLQESADPVVVCKQIDKDIAYIKVNRLVWETSAQRDSIKLILDNYVTTMNRENIKNMVLDIRGNLGGSSVFAKDILDYFTTTPYSLSEGVEYFYKGKRYDAKNETLHTPNARIIFKGSVVLLSDVLTYSSAHMMQVGFKHYDMGVTVGQQSTESHYITGEIKKTILKNSGIEIISPTVNFRLPGYSVVQRGFYTPDYVIYPSFSDRLNGKDVMLEKAIEILH